MKFPYDHLSVLYLCASSGLGFSKPGSFRATSGLLPEDYLWKGYGSIQDSVFDKPEVSLDLDIGLTSDCGQINIQSTVQAALRNILNAKYFKRVGQDILASSPMLLTCYMSPTWCAILKNFRAQANMLAQLRMNQCKAIDRYIDNRVNDFYAERQQCVRDKIGSTGGNFEKSMESCSNYEAHDFASWAGKGREKVNRLIQSTADWAGFKEPEAKRVVDLTKALIGDDIVRRGHVTVDWGPYRMQFTPRTYLIDLKKAKYETLCQKILPKVLNRDGSPGEANVSDKELKAVSGNNNPVLDRQTLLSLAYLPYQRRHIACRKLSDALALGNYTDDMAKTLDFIAGKLGTNPNLPDKQKMNADRKRQALKDQIEITLSIENQNRTPLNEVLYQINKEGAKYRKVAAKRQITTNQDMRSNDRIDGLFLDCGDGVGCK